MLNIIKKCDEVDSCGNNSGDWSIVSEENHPLRNNTSGHPMFPQRDASGNVARQGSDSGALILDGEEDGSKNGNTSTKLNLSVPETVFLPSEINSLEERLRASRELEEHVMDDGFTTHHHEKEWHRKFYMTWNEFSVQIPSRRKLLAATIIAVFIVFLPAWRYRIWKNEAMRLKDELDQYRLLMPLTLGLTLERRKLHNDIGLLQENLKELATQVAQNSHTSQVSADSCHREHLLSPEESSDDTVLLINNCYVQASLSLGSCSREWHNWWDEQKGSRSQTASDSYDSKHDEFPSFVDDAMGDMSRAVQEIFKGVADTSSRSYSIIEKNIKSMSYDGIKESLLSNDSFQKIINFTSETISNATNITRSLNLNATITDFDDAVYQLIRAAENAIEEGNMITKNVERFQNSFLGAFDYTTSLFKNASNLLTEEPHCSSCD